MSGIFLRKMDSHISNPMSGRLENETSTATVTLRTEVPSNDTHTVTGDPHNNGAQTSRTTANEWLQSLTANASLQIAASQLNELHDSVGVANNDIDSAPSPTPLICVQEDWFSNISGARYHNNGKYIIGYVDSTTELHQLLEEYIKSTGTVFPQLSSLNLTTKASEDEYLQQRFLTPSARPRLFWQMHAGEPIIHFDGVPFITVGHCTDVPCMLAGRRRTTTQLLVATGDVLPTKIQTQGCSAKISIRRILRYPSGRLPDSTAVQGVTAMRRLRKQALEELTAKICAGQVKPCERFYFSLPTPLGHDTHIVSEIEDPPSLIEPIHEEILRQINSAMTSVDVIGEAIRKFVTKNYGDNPTINIEGPTFNPSRSDLFRYIYWLYKSGRAMDQENCPFKEKYNLHVYTTTIDAMEANNEKSSLQATPIQTTPIDEEALVTMYNMAVEDAQDMTNSLELAPPHIGAEEVTGTSTLPVAMATKLATPSSRNTKKQASSGLLAIPRSSMFSNSPEYPIEVTSLQQSQSEVHSILTIIESQTYQCQDISALQTLRRQLTLLCTEFSVHLAGQKRPHPSPLIGESTTKRQNL